MISRRALLASPLLLGATVSSTRWISADLAGAVLSTNWPDPENAVSMGSMLKPFLALAYLQTHGSAPVIVCSRCWLPGGHGRQDLVTALANSCNTYFLALAGALNRAALDRICLQFGLLPPERAWPAPRLIGLGEGWPQIPHRVVRPFGALASDRELPGSEMVLAGMRRCATTGTARAIGFACYAKTGTGACCHHPAASGDGYVTAVYPPDSPRRVLLLQNHNTTGAHTALAAHALLRVIE